MPICEFLCGKGHLTEKIIFSIAEADKVDFIKCPKCGEKAGKQLSLPFPAHLHGSPEGYHKPSPCAKKTVNPDTLFFEGKGYAKNSKTGSS